MNEFKRTSSICVRLRPWERDAVLRAAEIASVPLSEYVRLALLADAERRVFEGQATADATFVAQTGSTGQRGALSGQPHEQPERV